MLLEKYVNSELNLTKNLDALSIESILYSNIEVDSIKNWILVTTCENFKSKKNALYHAKSVVLFYHKDKEIVIETVDSSKGSSLISVPEKEYENVVRNIFNDMKSSAFFSEKSLSSKYITITTKNTRVDPMKHSYDLDAIRFDVLH